MREVISAIDGDFINAEELVQMLELDVHDIIKKFPEKLVDFHYKFISSENADETSYDLETEAEKALHYGE
mgnify:FL=1